MKAIVSGAAGFVGSHLSEALIAEGHEVVGIDSFLDYYPRWIKEMNVSTLRQSPRFRLVEQNLIDVDWPAMFDGADVFYHLAAQAGVRASWSKNFVVYTKNNIEATQTILEDAKNAKLKKFVYASTSSLYGDTEDIPMKEDSLLKPVSPYGVTKMAAEGLCYLYWKNFGVPCVALRYFTVYGPRQRPDMAFYRFLLAIFEKRPIVVFEDGNQTRDFTFIQDIVRGTMLAAQDGAPGKVYNLGGGSRITVREVLQMLEEITGSRPEVTYVEKQKGDMRDTFASIERAQKDFGYQPTVKVKDGLTAEYRWLKDLFEKSLVYRTH